MDLFEKLFQAAIRVAVEKGELIDEDGVILSPKTIALINEIEQMHIEVALDKALAERDFETCKKLVELCK